MDGVGGVEAVLGVVMQQVGHVAHVDVRVLPHCEGEQRQVAVRAKHAPELG